MIQEYVDMDTQEKVLYVSESSNTSTSGYSTVSTLDCGGGVYNSPASSVFSMSSSSPAQSPKTAALQAEFSSMGMSSPHYLATTGAYGGLGNSVNTEFPTNPSALSTVQLIEQVSSVQKAIVKRPNLFDINATGTANVNSAQIKQEYKSFLRIIEQPVEKFRFRYKSEMHGTHGSLNGANSKRSPKTYPEVELCNYNGPAIIRCSLFQKNLDSPHSHQLVVRKDDVDICDPHDLEVSPEKGFVAQFQNMGIIHTAKKFILEELLKKKENRLKFEFGYNTLSTKQTKKVHHETEIEAKDMNLNQVRLCFEAFKIQSNNTWIRIAEPVFSNPINNRKAAQTGELRICRLSIATGTVAGGDDLILLVEKVGKKNIKVRFYELNEEEDIVWEDFARFRESDVHHQYAIVCQTPPYKNRDIEKPVEVNIELVRPSDDERSYPPITFRYKPREAVISRKRRRTTTSSSGSNSNSISSLELPKPVQDQVMTDIKTKNVQTPASQYNGTNLMGGLTISEEYNKNEEINKLLDSEAFRNMILNSSETLDLSSSLGIFGDLETDGASASFAPKSRLSSTAKSSMKSLFLKQKKVFLHDRALQIKNNISINDHLKRMFEIFDNSRVESTSDLEKVGRQIAKIFIDHAETNENGDSITHEIIASGDMCKAANKLFFIIEKCKLHNLLNRILNSDKQSALHYACLHNRANYIRVLCALGCDPNIQDCHGNTALHVAVREEQQGCIDRFYDIADLDLTIRNDEGLTPIHMAVRQNNVNLSEKLLKSDRTGRAALLGTLKEGNNVLHIAVSSSSVKMIEMIFELINKGLIDRKPLLLDRNAAGQTAWHIAKNLSDGNQILSALTLYYADIDQGSSFIKTEITFSTDEDEDESDERDEQQRVAMKNDEENDIEEESVSGNTKQTLKCSSLDCFDRNKKVMVLIHNTSVTEILNNKNKRQKLVNILKEDAKWKLLASKLKIQHLSILWTGVEDLLNYLGRNRHIDYEFFLTALNEVDSDASEIIKMGK